MKATALKKNPPALLKCGVFSKKDGANFVIEGVSNIHSSILGPRDTFARVTVAALQNNEPPTYNWELINLSHEIKIHNSANRNEIIVQAAEMCGITKNRDLNEKFGLVLEELISNAIFHAYENKKHEPKYSRSQRVTLEPREVLSVRFNAADAGVFVSVTDQGGSLQLEDVARVFKKCYSVDRHQIEAKEGGAGLGLYMIFEHASHLKIVSELGKRTVTSCWISDIRAYDPDYFSFNFFQTGEK
jgi:anti-sigma regulatory factor (Ser/Thr protein kinase)